MANFVFVDVSNLARRAFHSKSVVMTPDGLSGSLIPIIIGMLRKLKVSYPDAHFVCVFDGKQATNLIRKHLLPGYKENRRHTNPETPLEKVISKYFFQCQDSLFDSLRFLGIRCLKSEFLEADLLIAAQVSAKPTRLTVFPECKTSFVMSADVDYATMIRSGVYWLRPTQKKKIKGLLIRYDERVFYREFKVTPSFYPYVKLLQGDKSDGVSGLTGFGPVKSVKKIREIYSSKKPKTRSQFLQVICSEMGMDSSLTGRKLMLFDLSAPSLLTEYLISKIPENTQKGVFFQDGLPEKSIKQFRSYCAHQKALFREGDYSSLERVFDLE